MHSVSEEFWKLMSDLINNKTNDWNYDKSFILNTKAKIFYFNFIEELNRFGRVFLIILVNL